MGRRLSGLAQWALDGRANAALIERLAYLTRLEWYDPPAAALGLFELARLLGLLPTAAAGPPGPQTPNPNPPCPSCLSTSST
jgi:hypothetical protein